MMTEAEVQNMCFLEISRRGGRAWRNNVGTLLDSRGVPVFFGLANDAKGTNKRLKSSDIIGVMPGGRVISVECKHEGWTYKATVREKAQKRWVDLILRMGGLAGFVSCMEDLERVFQYL